MSASQGSDPSLKEPDALVSLPMLQHNLPFILDSSALLSITAKANSVIGLKAGSGTSFVLPNSPTPFTTSKLKSCMPLQRLNELRIEQGCSRALSNCCKERILNRIFCSNY